MNEMVEPGSRSDTPAYKTFQSNYTKFLRLYGFIDARISEEFNAGLRSLKKSRSKKARAEAELFLTDRLQNRSELRAYADEWFSVILVTATETYIHDVLAFAASLDERLMQSSEQSASYQKISKARSLAELQAELRSNWARNFVDKGGPTLWLQRLKKMGATGYKAGLGEELEQLWGVRHMIVHRAGSVTADFARRHPSFALNAGDFLRIEREYIDKSAGAVIDFVYVTERYFKQRLWPAPPSI
jgi:hypothetical protein